jgi:hypothetical protein
MPSGAYHSCCSSTAASLRKLSSTACKLCGADYSRSLWKSWHAVPCGKMVLQKTAQKALMIYPGDE